MKARILFLTHLIVLPLLAQDDAGFIKNGNKFYEDGKMNEAVQSYEKVREGRYKYVALMNKGNALYRMKKYEEAIKTYGQASSAGNTDVTLRSGAYYNAGVVYSNQKKIDESIEAYKNALRLNSNDTKARENLQKALLEKKKQSGGGGGGDNKKDQQQQQKSKLNQSQSQSQLDKLEEKEKNTQQRISEGKSQYGISNEKDW